MGGRRSHGKVTAERRTKRWRPPNGGNKSQLARGTDSAIESSAGIVLVPVVTLGDFVGASNYLALPTER